MPEGRQNAGLRDQALLPFLPLAAKPIALCNFPSDIPSSAIAADRVDPCRIARAQRWNVGQVRRFALVFGAISTGFDLLTFLLLLHVFRSDKALFQTAWFVASLLTEVAVLVLGTRRPALRSAQSRLLPWPMLSAMLAIVFACVLVTEVAKGRVLGTGTGK